MPVRRLLLDHGIALALAAAAAVLGGCGDGRAPFDEPDDVLLRGMQDPAEWNPAADAPLDAEDEAMWGWVDDPSEDGIDPRVVAEAKVVYDTRCARCHGARGDGQGPDAPRLRATGAPPRNFRSRAWQAASTDQHVRKIVVEGGSSVGVSGQMPPHAALASEPALLEALVQIVRSMPEGSVG